MEKEFDDSKKVVLGILIGGLVGAGALYWAHGMQNRKTPVLKKIGKTISDVGEMLENCDISSSNMMDTVDKKMPSGSDVISSLTDWVNCGMTLWKKFKRR